MGRLWCPAASHSTMFCRAGNMTASAELYLSRGDAQVDGVYDTDPAKNPDARLYRQLCYQEVMAGGLQVMDETAITLCKENDIPIVVFNVFTPGNILKAFAGDGNVGTVVSQACGLDRAAVQDLQDLQCNLQGSVRSHS